MFMTLRRVASEILGLLFMTIDTVADVTPARSAMSLSVTGILQVLDIVKVLLC
jgi:hypothetical protein